MRTLRLDASSPLVLTLAFSSVLFLPGCNVNVRKNAEGQEKKVDIETPFGALHVGKDADASDVGLPVYPGARRKDVKDDHDDNGANVNISSGDFGIRVVAVEFLSDDPPEKLADFYKDQLKKYGSVLECHPSKDHPGATGDIGGDDSGESKPLKCEGDSNGKATELKVGTRQNQRIVFIKPAESGKGSDFGLAYVRFRNGKDTI